jgi:hypothetical protein
MTAAGLVFLLLLGATQEAPASTPAPAADTAANEPAVVALLKQLVEAEAAWGRQNTGKRASFLDLILARQIPADLRDGIASGYRFKLTLSENQRAFEVLATPLEYGVSGTRSFFADRKGVRGEDARGEAASSRSPLLVAAEK